MGYDVVRFRGEVDEELICPICSGVLEEPLQVPGCEHVFCSRCIQEWLSRQPTCPVDRLQVSTADLKPVPRIVRNLLCRLVIACDNVRYGCSVEVKLDALSYHLAECEHNPTRPVPCKQGCGLVIPKDELKDHNCVRELRSLIHSQQQKITDFQQAVAEQRFQINEQKRELQLLKDFMRAMRSCSPAMRAISDQMERDDVVRWSNSLTRARILRWGGIISTPDPELQASVKLSLTESGCPPHLMDELMEHSHESRWPRGLSSLETRQLNRRHYENYVCKRIPGKQAVVVLQCDNFHMGDDLMAVPGLVMIFANGSNFSRGLLEDVVD